MTTQTTEIATALVKRQEELTKIEAAKAAAGISYKPLVCWVDDGNGGTRPVAFRRPKGPEWHRYRSASLDRNPDIQAGALQLIVVPCCIYPPAAEFAALIDDLPGTVEAAGNELVEFAGASRVKKSELL